MMLPLALALSLLQSGNQPPGEISFYSFFDRLAVAEIQVQIDRFDAAGSKGQKGGRTKVAEGVKNCLAIVRSYEATGLPALAATRGDEKFAEAFRTPLDRMISSLESLQSFLLSHGDGQQTREETALQNAQFAAFFKVVASIRDLPHFSEGALDPAAFYNIKPRLREQERFAILADPAFPGEARVWRTIGRTRPLLRQGDKVAGYWMPHDKKWMEVKSWRDITTASDDAADEKTHLILLKIRRRGKEIQASVYFVPAFQEAE